MIIQKNLNNLHLNKLNKLQSRIFTAELFLASHD